MWGNPLGWGISAVLVIAYIGGIAMIEMSLGISPPTSLSRDPANLAPITLSPDPATLVTMNDPSDAAPLYQQAISEFDAQAFDDYRHNTSPTEDDAAQLASLSPLLDATHLQTMSLFRNNPARLINYDNQHPDLTTLQTIGETADLAGLTAQKFKHNDVARKYYEAAFSLGAKLYAQRYTLAEFMAGATLMSESAAALAGVEPDKAADFNAEVEALKQNTLGVQKIQRAICSIDGPTIAAHAGDVFYFAQHAGERMWRVEAVLAMGRMRFNIGPGKKGDQTNAAELAAQMQNDPDPAVSIAAKAATTLTLEQYNLIGG